MPVFSLSLPTLRRQNLELVLEHIHHCSQGADYEVVVVSPFEVAGERLVHVPEEQASGNCPAHAAAYEASSGEYIITFTDDIIPTPGWLDGLQQLMEHKETRHFPFCGGLHRANWQIFGTVYGLYYPYFPVLSRRSAEHLGGYFSRDFAAHFGDPDLAMRVWDRGGRCELLPEVQIYGLHQLDCTDESHHKCTSLERDSRVFQAKWKERYGTDFGHQLRDFNIDYQIEDLYGRTYMANRVYLGQALQQGKISDEDLKTTTLTTLATSMRQINRFYEEATRDHDTARIVRLTTELRQLADRSKRILAGELRPDTGDASGIEGRGQ